MKCLNKWLFLFAQASPTPSSPARCSIIISIVWEFKLKTPYDLSVMIEATTLFDYNNE